MSFHGLGGQAPNDLKRVESNPFASAGGSSFEEEWRLSIKHNSKQTRHQLQLEAAPEEWHMSITKPPAAPHVNINDLEDFPLEDDFSMESETLINSERARKPGKAFKAGTMKNHVF